MPSPITAPCSWQPSIFLRFFQYINSFVYKKIIC
ncbi:MAG: hypothetical protein EOM03_17855 [Clostridia bacterium]|uniref:Uncharacterized protein n=1 Tax=Nitratidesulfovibrio vulgaris (strain ATCC 29579 / DSM 644 / CCUG 34227 / NCIMB 8303 / VKM B-1760 / Hildenborough) TaxID=882 RepID=Q72AI8_NITV2|nr:hypothetical protein DVU_2005 [Nitratidesulfovibrio vulgaris str. Hildenborough]NCC85955.1 hypothetical protein [Clostridia bacterium]RHH19733.1 hypothetical protein DW219_10455 [Desulfovibrio sp. AM18-2]